MVNAKNILQAKFDKVKSFMDNDTFVFTFSKAKAIGIHKDQLFKNQLYNNGIKINKTDIKRERITKLKTEYKSGILAFLYDSNRLIVHNSFFTKENGTEREYPDTGYQEISLEPYYQYINDQKIDMNEKIVDFDICQTNDEEVIICVLTNCNRVFICRGNLVWPKGYEFPTIDSEEIFVEVNEPITNVFSGSYNFNEGFFIKTIHGKVYFYNPNSINNDPESVSENEILIGENFEGLVDIKSAYSRTFFIMKNGTVFAHGDNTYGALGTGLNDERINGFNTKVCQYVETTDSYTNSIKNSTDIIDVAIGKNHTLFLTNSGVVLGFGDNSHYQLGDDNETQYSDIFKILSYPRSYTLSIDATEYGSILLSFDGKLVVTGTFVHGELGLKNHTDTINIDGYDFTGYFMSNELVKISRLYESTMSRMIPSYFTKLFNTFGNCVFAIKENGNIYYTGSNKVKYIGDAFGDSDVTVWTPLETVGNDLLRKTEPRPESWSYYFDFICNNNNYSGNSVENIYLKIKNKWIDWQKYVADYINVNIVNENNESYPKYAYEYDENGNVLKKYLNFDSFVSYLYTHPYIIDRYLINKKNIPSCDFIDENLNVWKINAGDNISCFVYTQEIIDELNSEYQESLNNNLELKTNYEEIIAESSDPDEVLEYQDRLATVNLNIESLNKLIQNNRNKLGKICSDYYLNFNDVNPINPLEVVGTKNKTVKYTRTVFNEDGTVKTETIDGITKVVKESVTREVEENVTKVEFEFINYDYIRDPSNSNEPVTRDDIKLTVHNSDDPNEKKITFDDMMVWLSGKFVNFDFGMNDDNTEVCIYNGMSALDTRRICEYPGLGEPSKNSESVPKLQIDNATVIEPTYPTEVRFDARLRTFAWKDVKVKGPYQIHDTNNLSSELQGVEHFYFGDMYCSVFTEIKLRNMHRDKNTFLLFMHGAVVNEDEYTIRYSGNDTIIKLKNFTAYVVSLLQDYVDVKQPGHVGKIRHILSMFNDMQPFSIAFFESEEPYKKVKLFYDYQNIRNFPKPGQVMFNDIKYNDLVLVDGFYIPYLWEASKCIRFPETFETLRTSENNFINHSNIYKIRPYTTYKTEAELTDNECRSYAFESGLITEFEYSNMEIGIVRDKVKAHINSRIKDI